MLLEEARTLNDAFAEVARRHKGRVIRQAGVMALFPEILVVHDGLDAVIEVGSGGIDLPRLELHLFHRGQNQAPGFGMRFEQRSTMWATLGHMFGRYGLLRDPRRPGWFQVETPNRAFLRHAMPGPMVTAAMQLADMPQAAWTLASLSASLYLVRSSGLVWTAEELENFMLAALALYDGAQEAARTGAPPPSLEELPVSTFALLAAAVGSPSARCGVCAEPVRGPSLVCTRCESPHHADCWKWTGGCSVYACGGKVADVRG